MSSKEELFAELFSGSQQRLFGYVLGLVRNSADAQDIVQQTAVTAWRKFDAFDPETNFLKWTVTIARFETLNFIKYRRRNKVYFNQVLMEQLGDSALQVSQRCIEDRSEALSSCLTKLSETDKKLVECRYSHGLGSIQIAELLDRPQASICNSLKRIRESLLLCIRKTLAQEDLA